MNMMRTARSIIVDDLATMITDIRRNLSPALELEGVLLEVLEEFTDYTAAGSYLVKNPGSVDLVVTDVLWPRPAGSVPRQEQQGLQVIRYARDSSPDALIVALSLGDEVHRTVRRWATEAGAHIVRLHDEDLPGEDGSGWLELGRIIADRLRAGPPYPKSPSPPMEITADAFGPGAGVRDLVVALRRLRQVARPLVRRRRQRPGLELVDETDIQDLVEAVLWAWYDDVRPEERTPSIGGSSSVIDFLLRDSSIAVEVKVASTRHSERKVKEELLIDANDYAGHPSVRTLVAVVADLESAIRNPKGFETDLSGTKDRLLLQTIVVDLAPLVGRSPQS